MMRSKLLFLYFGSTLTMAQTGPGGVGNASSNPLWLSADIGVFVNSGTAPANHNQLVQQWNDRSGNGRHAIQPINTHKPVYRTNAVNGYPSLLLRGNQFLDAPAPGISSTGSYTYLMCFRDTAASLGGTTDGNGHFILDRDSATFNLVSFKLVTGNRYFYQKRNNANGGLGGVTSTTAVNTNSKIVTLRRNYNVNYQYFHNNAQEGGDLSDSDGATTPPRPRIGRHATTTNGGLCGYFNEMIIYNFALNSSQTIIVNNYLAAKYGLALAANDVYREDQPARGNYDHEVAGIGRTSVGNLHTDARGTGIVRISNPTGLANNEFLIWGHDNGVLGAWGVGDVPTGLEGRFQRTWRVSERNTTGTASVDVGAVDITFDLSGLGPVDPAELRLLVDSDQDGSFADEVPLEGAWNVSGNQYRFSAVTALVDGSRFTLGTTDLRSTPLPVELLFFEVVGNGPVVDMTWATASEQGNDRFNVERSADGSEWIDVVEVTGAGTSNQLLQYSAVDEQPLTGVNFYRLRQTDQDGTMTWSDVRSLMRTITEADGPFVSPNPTDGPVVLSWPAGTPLPEHIQVLDASGRDLAVEQHPLGANGLTMDLAPFPPGIYVIRLEQAGRPKSIRVLR